MLKSPSAPTENLQNAAGDQPSTTPSLRGRPRDRARASRSTGRAGCGGRSRNGRSPTARAPQANRRRERRSHEATTCPTTRVSPSAGRGWRATSTGAARPCPRGADAPRREPRQGRSADAPRPSLPGASRPSGDHGPTGWTAAQRSKTHRRAAAIHHRSSKRQAAVRSCRSPDSRRMCTSRDSETHAQLQLDPGDQSTDPHHEE